jgi:hypothetical protein
MALALLLLLFPATLHAAPPTHASRIFEVAAFGASPNGSQDSSPAIGRAAQAASAAGGGVVHFPCGDWRADAVLHAAPAGRSALYLDGIANIVFRGEGKCSRIFTSVPVRTVFEIHASSNVSFEHLRIEPAAALFHEHYQNDGGSAIRLSGVNGGFIRDVEMSGGSSALLWITAGTANYTVTRSYLHHAFGNSALWEDDCSATDSALDCGTSLPPHGNAIEDNLFVENGTNGGTAQVVLDAGGHVTGTRVSGNTIRGRPEAANPHIHGIQVRNAGGAWIERNRIVDVLDDGIAVTADDLMTIAGTQIVENTIEGGCRDAAIILYASPDGRVERTVLRGNHIHSTEGRGIVLHGTIASHLALTEIVDNDLSYPALQPSLDAFTLRGSDIRLENNRVSATGPGQQIWIRIDPDSARVTGIGTTRRLGGGNLSIFDPATVSDASKGPRS